MLATQHSSTLITECIPKTEYKIQNRKKKTQNREREDKSHITQFSLDSLCQFIVNRLCGWMFEQQTSVMLWNRNKHTTV